MLLSEVKVHPMPKEISLTADLVEEILSPFHIPFLTMGHKSSEVFIWASLEVKKQLLTTSQAITLTYSDTGHDYWFMTASKVVSEGLDLCV